MWLTLGPPAAMAAGVATINESSGNVSVTVPLTVAARPVQVRGLRAMLQISGDSRLVITAYQHWIVDLGGGATNEYSEPFHQMVLANDTSAFPAGYPYPQGTWVDVPTFMVQPKRPDAVKVTVILDVQEYPGSPAQWRVQGMSLREVIKDDMTGGVRLDVETDPPAGTLINLLPNPSGQQGGYAWETPTAGSTLRAVPPFQRSDGWQPQRLEYSSAAAASNVWRTEPFPVTASQWVRARWFAFGVTRPNPGQKTFHHRARIEWLNSAKTLLSSTAWTNGPSGTQAATTTTAAAQAPASTAFARLVFELGYHESGTYPLTVAGHKLQFREVTVCKAASSAALNTMPASESPTYWTNVIGSAISAKVTRNALDVGSLEAKAADSALDPATAATLKPGRLTRLAALAADGTWQPIITGQVAHADATYDLARLARKPGDPKHVRIDLLGVDNVQRLAATGRPDGVGTLANLAHVLEGAGVPWVIDGDSNHVVATTITRVEQASALDQIAIVRDSVRGYAWVDRDNTFQAWGTPPAADPVPLLTEADYADLDVAFNTSQLINEVTITLLRRNLATGQTVEVPYGPYRDQTSIDTWGVRSAAFKLQGLTDSSATMSAYANAVFAANATPTMRVNGVRVPIRDSADVHAGKALLDLYGQVRVTNTAKGIDQTSRVTSIEHEIDSSGRWVMLLGFSKEGGVAPPQVTPGPGVVGVAGLGAWTNIPLASGYASYDGAATRPQYLVDDGMVWLRGLVSPSSGNFTTAGAMIGTLPVVARPGQQILTATDTGTTSAHARLQITDTGDVYVRPSVACQYVSLATVYRAA